MLVYWKSVRQHLLVIMEGVACNSCTVQFKLWAALSLYSAT